jgi:hypothetical protein
MGQLPWQGVKGKSDKERTQKIFEKKKETVPKELCKYFPEEIKRYFEYILKLGFDEKPNYVLLQGLINDLMQKYSYSNDLNFDWYTPKFLNELYINSNIDNEINVKNNKIMEELNKKNNIENKNDKNLILDEEKKMSKNLVLIGNEVLIKPNLNKKNKNIISPDNRYNNFDFSNYNSTNLESNNHNKISSNLLRNSINNFDNKNIYNKFNFPVSSNDLKKDLYKSALSPTAKTNKMAIKTSKSLKSNNNNLKENKKYKNSGFRKYS